MATMVSNVYLKVSPDELIKQLKLAEEGWEIANANGIPTEVFNHGEDIETVYHGTVAELRELYDALADIKVVSFLVSAEDKDEYDAAVASFSNVPGLDVEWRPSVV